MAEIYSSSPIYSIGSGEIKYQAIGDNGQKFNGKYRIRYFDIDGTILKIEYVSAGGEITPPEETPNFDPNYLTFSGWNYNIDDLQVEGPMDIGAMYTTGGDIHYAFIDLKTNDDYTVSVGVKTTYEYEIDWGDGIITTDTTSHIYNNIGKYIIKITGTLVGKLLSTKNYLLTKAYLGDNYILPETALYGTFNDARNIKYVSFPRVVTNDYTSGLFNYANSLIHCNLPYVNNSLEIGAASFYYCVNLKTISLSQYISSVSGFEYTYQLKEIILPKGTQILSGSGFQKSGITYITIPTQTNTTFPASAFNLASLKQVIVPEGITILDSSCFQSNNMIFIDLPSTLIQLNSNALASNQFHTVIVRSTIVPVLGSANQLGQSTANNNNGLTIWVNDDILEDLKVAQNWSTYANRMKPLSQYEGDY